MTNLSRMLDLAEKTAGLKVAYDSYCGGVGTGLVTISGPKLDREVFVEVRCAKNEGLCFVRDRSTHKTLDETMCAIGVFVP